MNEAGILDRLIQRLKLDDFREIILESSNTRFDSGKLVWLDLGCKDISSLPPDIFNPFPNLEYIGLYGNQLESVPPDLLSKQSHLRILDLGENNIRALSEDFFRSVPNLQYLWMYSNLLSDLPSNIFKNLHNLVELNLNSNKLTKFPVDYVSHMKKLRRLELALNKFDELDPRIVETLPNLDKLVFNILINGNLHIVNHIHKDEEIRVEEGRRMDEFVLVTGLMGSGKSTFMKHYSSTRINPKIPPVGKNILYDNIFGVSIGDNKVANFFEIDGPTVTSWTKFIEISRITVVVVNTLMTDRLDRIEKLMKHVFHHKRPESRIVVILNNYEGSRLETWFDENHINIEQSEITFFSIPRGEVTPDVGGLQRTILDKELVNKIIISIAKSLN